jgi:phosphoserine phosphatase RsbU/P
LTTDPTWRRELDIVDRLMRAVSRESDPNNMVQIYGEGVRRLLPNDGYISLSRRGLSAPRALVTRFSGWERRINPWEERHLLPVLEGGLLSDLLYAGEPRVIDHLAVDPADPSAPYIRDARALVTLPQYDDGVAQNMTLLFWNDPADLPLDRYPNLVWQANLFGRATLNLVLRRELSLAYEALDREMKTVGEMQRLLLPKSLPDIASLSLAAHYQTSQRAGGDYYDAFPLPGGRWGLCIADVSGHGTPAAVMMAVTHAIAHNLPGPPQPPGDLLGQLNRRLMAHYLGTGGDFVTGFYATYDPATRRLEYANAGHNPPRVLSGTSITPLDAVGDMPLGIDADQRFAEAAVTLAPGDRLVLYTDGITEARSPSGELFGEARLDDVLRAGQPTPARFVDDLVGELGSFCGERPPDDDRTVLAGWVT